MSRGEGVARRLRIAVVVPKFGLIGGGERFAYELTERLSRNDRFEFHVFANRWTASSPRITFHKVSSIRVPRFLRPWIFAWIVEQMVARGGFDIIHTHERVLRADIFSMHSVPHASWVRHVRRKRPTLFDWATIGLEHRMMANASRSWFLPVSTLAAEMLQRQYRIDPARVRVVAPGVDADRFSGPDRAACRAEIRSRHGIGASDFVVLFVGMNFEVKGLDAVIASVAKARRARADAGIRLLVVGRGDARKYGRLAREHGIADAVTFAGAIAGGVERYYRAADVFAMLSAFDTFGMVVLEAMAAGLPVIVSANVGAKDLVKEGTNGFVLANGGNADAAAEKIILLLNEAARAAMGEAGFRTASRDSWERTASEVARLYEEVADRRTSR